MGHLAVPLRPKEGVDYDFGRDMLAWPVGPSVGCVAHTADVVAAVGVEAALVVHTRTEAVVEGAAFDAVGAEDVVDIDAVAVVVVSAAAAADVVAAAGVDTSTCSRYSRDCWPVEECHTRSCTLL
jgi:hypothetical protein